MRRATITAVVGLLLAGCWPVGVERGPAGRIGPTLLVEVTNRSARELPASYEFTAAASMGGGESLVASCERLTQVWGDVAGTFAISIDGKPVLDAEVAPGTPLEGYLVVRIEVGPDGEASVIGAPRWTRLAPDPGAQPVPCG